MEDQGEWANLFMFDFNCISSIVSGISEGIAWTKETYEWKYGAAGVIIRGAEPKAHWDESRQKQNMTIFFCF